MDTAFPQQQMTDPALSTILLYQTADGRTTLDVRLQEETVWLTQAQMVELFQRDKRTISEHVRNIFKEGELTEAAVVRKSRITAADGKSYLTTAYNLDVVISVGYRVKSLRGTQFRIWASSVLKEYLIKGYALNQRQLADATGLAVVELVRRYGLSWQLLLQYDEDRLALPSGLTRRESVGFDLAVVRRGIACL